MANRAEVLEKLKSAASEGNIREAYREFEELPIVDQLAISISPGVGDALALYEIGEFGARGAKNVAENDFLGALGNYGLSGLSAISLLPLFRLFRGAKAVKTVDPIADTPALPAKIETAEVVEEAVKDVPVPKVEEFKPLSLDEMTYPGTKVRNFGLTSKAAKFINTNKKLPNQGKAIGYINALEKAGVPKGELRLLNLIDEAGEIHPKLLSELEIRNPQGKITRQRLANYIKANQQDTLRKKIVSRTDAEARNRLIQAYPSQNLVNEKEITYHIPGIERGKDLGRHYNRKPEHEAHYAFDAAAEFELPNLDFQLFKEGDKVLNVGRIQSDYSRELGGRSTKNRDNQIEYIFDNEKIDLLADNMDASLRSFAIRVARENPQLKTADELKAKINQKIEAGKDLPPSMENIKFDLDQIQADITTIRGYSPFEAINVVVKTAQQKFPITPYIDSKAIAALKKSLNEYNQIVPKVNELSQKELKLQDEIKATGLDLNSPSLQDSLDELSEIRKERTDLIPSDVIDKFDGFTLNKSELENATGKKFTESLGKSIDEIFYELEAIKPGSPAMRQKYGPGSPEDRALRYFNEMVNNNQMTFDIGNGVKILKKATRVNTDNFKGVPIDPYAKGTKTEMYKLPLRARFVEAVERGFDGFSLDSAGKRLGDENPGDVDNKFLKPLYDQDGPNEINKMLKDLGVDPKEYVERIDARGNKPFSGTYVKIDDEIRKLVKEKGLDAFRFGGPVGIQESLNELNKVILPIDISSDVGSIQPVEESISAKDVTDIIFDPTDPVDYAILGAGPLSKFALSANKTRKLIDKVLSLKQRGRQAAAKELIDSDDLKLFKEFEVMPIKNRLGAYYDLGAAKFGGVKMRVPKDTPYAIRRNNLKTGKPYTAKEIDDIAYSKAGDSLSYLFKTLEEGGNSAKKVMKRHPEVAALYKKSGREIPPVALRPDQLKEYIKGEAKGLNAGGPVGRGPIGIQESLNELNKIILPNPPDVGSIKPNDLDTLMKEVGTSPVGSEGLERQAILLAMATLSMNPLQRAQAIRKQTAPLIKKLKSLHKEKQNYVENNSATQLNKYAERINRYNRDIKSTEEKIKRVSELYDPKNYNTGGPVSIDNMLAAL
jgi:hypothetical protein